MHGDASDPVGERLAERVPVIAIVHGDADFDQFMRRERPVHFGGHFGCDTRVPDAYDRFERMRAGLQAAAFA